MPRFFVPGDHEEKDLILLSGADAHHIERVLRMKTGDRVQLCNGKGVDYDCVIRSFEKDGVHLCCVNKTFSQSEPSIKAVLFMAVPKQDKLEFVVQKAVELGISRVVPFFSERCVVRWDPKDVLKKTERLRKIAYAAAKQCGRGVIPEISEAVSFSEMLQLAKESAVSFLAYENEQTLGLQAFLSRQPAFDSISFIIGSEGGFTGEEADACQKAGISAVSLGKRILRCETAPVAVLSAVMYQTGNL